MHRKFGALSSSADPQQLSKTIESVLKIIGYVVGSLAALQGVDVVIVNQNVQEIANLALVLTPAILVIKESGPLVFAAIRRILAAFYAKFN